MLAGDLVDNDKSIDGSTKDWPSSYELAAFLNENKIQTFFIRGNWDERAQYDKSISATYRLPCVEDIPGRMVAFNEVRVLGIPFSFTKHLQTCKCIQERFPEPVALVLAHAKFVRVIWLFTLETRFQKGEARVSKAKFMDGRLVWDTNPSKSPTTSSKYEEATPSGSKDYLRPKNS